MHNNFDPRRARALGAVAAAGAAALAASLPAHAATTTDAAKGQKPFGYGLQFSAKLVHTINQVPAVAQAELVKAEIIKMVHAGNQIARLPYVWGGGHGSFTASGYDCSGSVSYLLHAAGLLTTPDDSSGLMSYGVPGPGKYVTVYANSGHAWMTILGHRYDTIAFQETGTRWSNSMMPTSGYTEVHPPGL